MKTTKTRAKRRKAAKEPVKHTLTVTLTDDPLLRERAERAIILWLNRLDGFDRDNDAS